MRARPARPPRKIGSVRQNGDLRFLRRPPRSDLGVPAFDSYYKQVLIRRASGGEIGIGTRLQRGARAKAGALYRPFLRGRERGGGIVSLRLWRAGLTRGWAIAALIYLGMSDCAGVCSELRRAFLSPER